MNLFYIVIRTNSFFTLKSRGQKYEMSSSESVLIKLNIDMHSFWVADFDSVVEITKGLKLALFL